MSKEIRIGCLNDTHFEKNKLFFERCLLLITFVYTYSVFRRTSQVSLKRWGKLCLYYVFWIDIKKRLLVRSLF